MLVLIAAAVLGVNAVSHLRTATPDYREGLVSDERPLSLNPLVGATDPVVRDVGELLYRRLLKLDNEARPAADLATGYQVSPDGLSYHLALRPGQLWSDGRPITVADVVKTVGFVQSAHFGDLATAAPWQDVHASASTDGVTFDLAAPRASFPALLTQLPILPLGGLSAAQLARLPSVAAVPMPSSGPYRVVSADATMIALFPNPHSNPAPRLNQVELDLFGSFTEAAAAFRAGREDGVLAGDPLQRAELVGAGGHSEEITTFRFVDLLLNERGPALADLVVREAIASAIDRGALVNGPLQQLAVAQTGAIPAGIAWAQPTVAPSSPQVSAAALAADGWVLGEDGVRARGSTRLTVRLAAADAVPLPGVGRAIAAQLAPLGIAVTVTPMTAPALRALFSSPSPDFDMALADWDIGPDPDVSSFWRSTATPPAGFNVSGGPVDPFLDQALDRLATLADPQARRTAATAVSSQLDDDLPAVFIETPRVALVLRPGITVVLPPVGDSGARFADIAAWHRG